MPENLTPRLAAVADLVPRGKILADIGTDHAHLPLALLQSGHIPFAFASDLRQGPLDNAAQNAAFYGLSGKITLRLGDGLAAVAPSEAEIVVLAGMGGETIAAILQNGAPPGDSRTFILQPMTRFFQLRAALASLGFGIFDWRLALEGRRVYECLAVSRQVPAETDEVYLHIGRKTPETEGLYPIYVKDRLRRLIKKRNGLLRAKEQNLPLAQSLSALIRRMEKEVPL